MSSRRFGQIPCALWRRPEFANCSDDAKLALMFLYCGPYSTSSGVYWLEDAAAASALRWNVTKWIATRSELESAGLIAWAPETSEVFVTGYLATNRPQNRRGWEAVRRQIENIFSETLKSVAEDVFCETEKPGD